MNDLSTVTRSFAYDSIRIDNQRRHIGVDYIADGHHPFDKALLEEYGDCIAIPLVSANHVISSYIPLPSLSSDSHVFSRVEIHEQLIKQCMAEVDANPLNPESWMKYIQIYETFAEEAETRKERISMLQMENELLNDALKKLPKDPKLINAKINVLINVFLLECAEE